MKSTKVQALDTLRMRVDGLGQEYAFTRGLNTSSSRRGANIIYDLVSTLRIMSKDYLHSCTELAL